MEQPTILIVEADILVRHPMSEYLRECGYRVIEAADTHEARLQLDQGQPVVDVILADIAARTEPDFDFARWARANHPGAELVLAGTAERAVDKAEDLCKQGPALTKPYDHAFVAERIRKLLADRAAKLPGRA